MNMNEAIKKMIDCSDLEFSYVGEQFGWHTERYIAELMELGLGREEAENALARFCESVADDVEAGREPVVPYYPEELVAEIANRYHKEVAA